MTTCDIKRLALILSIYAKIKAMKTDNNQRVNDQRYNESHFYKCQQELEDLAYKHDEQL